MAESVGAVGVAAVGNAFIEAFKLQSAWRIPPRRRAGQGAEVPVAQHNGVGCSTTGGRFAGRRPICRGDCTFLPTKKIAANYTNYTKTTEAKAVNSENNKETEFIFFAVFGSWLVLWLVF